MRNGFGASSLAWSRRATRTAMAAGVAATLLAVPARAADLGAGLRLVPLAEVPAPVMAYTPVNTTPPPQGGMAPEVQQSLGCALLGTIGTGAAIVAGGENLVNIIAGGVVAPQNKAVLYIGLVGVVFASFCAIGQALTPLYLYAVSGEEEATPPRTPALGPQGRPAPLLRTATSAHGPLATLVVQQPGPGR